MMIAISLTCIACGIGGISIYLTWDLMSKLKRQRALPAPWETDITRIMTHVMPVLSGPYGPRRELGSWDDLHRSLLQQNSHVPLVQFDHVPLAQFEFDYEVQALQYRFTSMSQAGISMLSQRKEPTHYTRYPGLNAVVPDDGYVPDELEQDREKLVLTEG